MQTHSSVKVAVITGAAKRIGAEIARILHQAQMNVILHYNASFQSASDLCKELNQKRPHSAAMIQADLQDLTQIHELIAKAANEWSRIDLLVNNASKFYKTDFLNATEYEWDDLMRSNLKAPFFLAKAAVPFLLKTRGTIINIGDIHGKKPLRNHSIYCLSKSGLIMLTKVLAKELAPEIRVNTICPGAVLWPEGENELSSEEKNKIINHTLLKRAGLPQDIARAVLFFVQDAPYVTGQTLMVDGGRLLC